MGKNDKVEISATLYHATWCGYCKEIMPEWSTLQERVLSRDVKHDKTQFKINAIESENIPSNATVEGKSIAGFPTIAIDIKKGDLHQQITYKGKRTADEMAEFLKIIADRAQD